MSRSTIIIIVVAAVVILGGGALLLANNNKSSPPTTSTTGTSSMDMSQPSTSTNSTSASNESTNPSASTSNSVTIENFAFSPANITVKKGTAVTWTNKDSASHTVTENDSQKGPDSGAIANGKSYTFTFDTVGTFHYHCSIHPNMTGTVTVTE